MINKANAHKPDFDAPDPQFMQYALQLAANGAGHVSPNPMVGAVITGPDGRITGRGWHRRYGGPHAEVNAVNSVSQADRALFPQSTIYVTLEPCSHYGKTPPCSKLLVDIGIGRVVVGIRDPFAKVDGRGITMLRENGIEVVEGMLEKECYEINRRFFTAHTLHRPFILLKWAQSADGYMGLRNEEGVAMPVKFSNPLSMAAMHKERSLCDGILVGTGTIISDNPSLTVRKYPGNSPRRIAFHSPRLPRSARINDENTIFLDPTLPLSENLGKLYKNQGITSLMVEGGAGLLKSFMEESLFDEIRVETATDLLLHGGIEAPALPSGITLSGQTKIYGNIITHYRKNSMA